MNAFLKTLVGLYGFNTLLFVFRLLGLIVYTPDTEALRNFDSIVCAGLGLWAAYLLWLA